MSLARNLFNLVFGLALLAVPASGGHREGNGGDHIRAMFIKMGHAVIEHLRNTPDGQALVLANQLDVDALLSMLTTDVIKVVDFPLIDNGGSRVDALGEPGRISLSQEAWFDHLEKERDVYYLVFHEMLRSAAIDDDDYVISGRIMPFPAAERVATSIVHTQPLISEDNVGVYLDLSKPVFAGSGCPVGPGGVFVDFDLASNVLGLRFTDLRTVYRSDFPIAESRKNCSVSVTTRQLPAGKRLVVNQLDVFGEVDLPATTSFTLIANPYFSGSLSTATISKTISAIDGPVAGRTMMRSEVNVLATTCGSPGKLLNIGFSGRVKASQNEAMGAILGASLYLRLEDCDP